MTCKVGKLLDPDGPLEAVDRELLAGWVARGTDHRGRRQPAARMSQALAAEGHTVGPTTLKDHRSGSCACCR